MLLGRAGQPTVKKAHWATSTKEEVGRRLRSRKNKYLRRTEEYQRYISWQRGHIHR